MAAVDRIHALLDELDSIRGLIPKHYTVAFVMSGVRLDKSMFAPAPLRAPCPALVKGRPCKNLCTPGCDMCGIHQLARERRENPKVKARCSAMTASGTQCRCNAYKTFGMCKRHGIKEGLIPEPPSECAICYESMDSKNRKETRCGHFFHTACIATYAEMRGGVRITPRGKREIGAPCPMCRAPFKMLVPPTPVSG
jgi:hypothetical protein